MTHSNPIVHDAAFIYSQAIAYLLKNSQEAIQDKAVNAFNHALSLCGKMANYEYRRESVANWLQIAVEKAEE